MRYLPEDIYTFQCSTRNSSWHCFGIVHHSSSLGSRTNCTRVECATLDHSVRFAFVGEEKTYRQIEEFNHIFVALSAGGCFIDEYFNGFAFLFGFSGHFQCTCTSNPHGHIYRNIDCRCACSFEKDLPNQDRGRLAFSQNIRTIKPA